MTATTASNGTSPPKITLYTNHGCPYAHRAHIALAELGLPFEEVLIDLTTPRPQWYLDINPRGLVPTIKYSVPGVMDDEEILTESQIVAQFLVDAHASHLQPGTQPAPTAPLVRARQAWFIKTWEEKAAIFFFAIMRTSDVGEKKAKCEEWAAVLQKEIEPHFAKTTAKAPFFGGSEDLTFVEVVIAPFLLRLWAFAEDGELIPKEFYAALQKLPGLVRWQEAIRAKETVTRIYDEKSIVSTTKARIQKMQEAQSK